MYLLDTNAVNAALKQQIDADRLVAGGVCVAHIQRNEVDQTSDEPKKAALLAKLEAIGPHVIPTASAVWGVSEWGASSWSDGTRYSKLLKKIQQLDKIAGRKKLPKNQQRDALIADTAIDKQCILVTNDANLEIAAAEEGCHVINFAELLRRIP